jgi:hypothetical protein
MLPISRRRSAAPAGRKSPPASRRRRLALHTGRRAHTPRKRAIDGHALLRRTEARYHHSHGAALPSIAAMSAVSDAPIGFALPEGFQSNRHRCDSAVRSSPEHGAESRPAQAFPLVLCDQPALFHVRFVPLLPTGTPGLERGQAALNVSCVDQRTALASSSRIGLILILDLPQLQDPSRGPRRIAAATRRRTFARVTHCQVVTQFRAYGPPVSLPVWTVSQRPQVSKVSSTYSMPLGDIVTILVASLYSISLSL